MMKNDKVVDVAMIIITIDIFLFINLIYITNKTFKFICYIKSKKDYEKYKVILGEFDENIDLNTYDLVLALTLYYKKFDIINKQYIFERFYKKENYLSESNEINDNRLIKLPYYERELLKQIQYENKIESEIKFPTWSEIKEDIKESFTTDAEEKNNSYKANEEIDTKNRKCLETGIINDLKKKGFVRRGSILMFFDKLIDFLDKKYNELPNSILKITNVISKFFKELATRRSYEFQRPAGTKIFLFIIFIVFCIIFSISNIYITMALTVGIIILMFAFGNRLFLSKRGEIERVRICNCIKDLRSKGELTERERLFLNVLK